VTHGQHWLRPATSAAGVAATRPTRTAMNVRKMTRMVKRLDGWVGDEVKSFVFPDHALYRL
jgi:hypothetical protein